MPDYGLRILGDAYLNDHELSDYWLAEYDPDFDDGRGYIRGTEDPDEAMRFNSAMEALELWRAVSTVRPLRPDGKPNRPLSAFSVEVGRFKP